MHLLVHQHAKKRKSHPSASAKKSRDREFWIHFLDRVTLAVGVLGPLTDIPQITKILLTRNAAGVSALAWAGAAFFDVPFLIYGIVHKDRAITTTYSLWLIGNFVILVLTVLYS